MIKLERSKIAEAVKMKKWQLYRETLKGKSLKEKKHLLKIWLFKHNNSKNSQIQVQNYLNALKRAGIIKDIERQSL